MIETLMQKFIKENSGYLIGLIIVSSFLYVFNLHGVLFWDDADWILNNPAVHAVTWGNLKFIFSHNVLAGIGLTSNYYRPFLFVTFLINYLVSGSSPISYHIISNSIHIGNGLIFFYLCTRWLKSSRAAFLASLLFLIHPLQTESIAYISGRGDPLSVFCILLGILLYLKNRKILAALLAVVAVLSRETAVLFPVYLGLFLVAFEYVGTLRSRLQKAFVAMLPYIAISVAYTLLRITILNFQNTLNFYEQANVYSAHLSVRLYTFLHVLLTYCRLLIWPIGLHMDRDIPISLTLKEGWAWLGACVLIAMVSWLVYLFQKKKNPHFYVWLAGVGLFFIALGPVTGIIPINARIYEHWLYFSIAGAALIAGFYIDQFLKYLEGRQLRLKPAVIIMFVLYCLFLSVQTIRRNILWGNTEEFYKNILSYEPDDVRVLNNLGNWYSDHGNNAAAAPLYIHASSVEPTQPAPYYNLGNIYRDAGDTDKALELYRKAIEVSPGFHYAYTNIASIYLSQQKYREALDILLQLQNVYPTPAIQSAIQEIQKKLN
jgi:tetratricopeptide (TPR) repeat protein